MTVTFAKNSTAPSITDTFQTTSSTGVTSPIDLTGASVRFRMRARNSSTLKVDSPATIVSAAAGTVRYNWGATDLDTAGDYIAWWKVTFADSTLGEIPEFPLEVRDHATVTTDLTTMGAVRVFLGKKTWEKGQDDVVSDLITRASALITKYTGREFTPVTATRTFQVRNPSFFQLPWDLQSASLIRLSPESATPTTLTNLSDYSLGPLGSYEGVFNTVQLYNANLGNSNTAYRFGYAQVEITGVWGFPSVPADIEHACIVTVATWLRRDVAAFGHVLNIDEGLVERPKLFPSAVLSILDLYKRFAIA